MLWYRKGGGAKGWKSQTKFSKHSSVPAWLGSGLGAAAANPHPPPVILFSQSDRVTGAVSNASCQKRASFHSSGHILSRRHIGQEMSSTDAGCAYTAAMWHSHGCDTYLLQVLLCDVLGEAACMLVCDVRAELASCSAVGFEVVDYTPQASR
eukprot:408121-Rhodomonas_salina.1